jgi:hypothetical protein
VRRRNELKTLGRKKERKSFIFAIEDISKNCWALLAYLTATEFIGQRFWEQPFTFQKTWGRLWC